MIYMFTDGYADQFGEKAGKKYNLSNKSEMEQGIDYINNLLKTSPITKEPEKPDPNKPYPNKPKQPRYRNCGEGPFTKGCRTAPEGPIGQVQACLNLVQDGKFWNKTQAALVSKRYSNGFTRNDIPKICEKTNVVTPPKDEFDTQVDADSFDDIIKQLT
jgi:hypothetical protein